MSDNSDFHEIWFVYAPERHPWGGLRIAHLRKTVDGMTVVVISEESGLSRVGLRVWEDIVAREGWVKVKRIEPPTKREVDDAVALALRKIAQDIRSKMGFKE